MKGTLPIRWLAAVAFAPKTRITHSTIAGKVPALPGADGHGLTRTHTDGELQRLQDEIAAWQQRTFPAQTLKGKLSHLVKEAGELRDDPDDLMEWADVGILLLGAAAMRRLSVDDLVKLARIKFEVVKQRKWGEVNGEGFHHHVKD